MSRKKRVENETALLSRSTILILSGFLIGLSSGRLTGDEVSLPVLTCGIAGCLAFVAFDVAGTRRILQQAHRERVQMEQRLDRHLHSLHVPQSSLGDPTDLSLPHKQESPDLVSA